ncbi:transcription elongation factor GreA [Holosporaceae bacterium 'Namur']|nr:transcription elongation factor GreA [Holosporaceae bacterium 'Namur']
MSDKFPITPEGYEKLNQELTKLKSVERPAIIVAIAEARAHGDLSENAEYSAAREKQGFIEAKLADLESKLSRAEIIDVKSLSGDKVVFGATVTLVDEDTEEEMIYRIVSDIEADIAKGAISFSSPVAKALLGRNKGETVEVYTPKGLKYYEILNVQFIS